MESKRRTIFLFVLPGLFLVGLAGAAWACVTNEVWSDPAEAAAGDEVVVYGDTWEAQEGYVKIMWDSADGQVLAETQVSPQGEFEVAVTIPEGAAAGSTYLFAQQFDPLTGEPTTEPKATSFNVTQGAAASQSPQGSGSPAGSPAEQPAPSSSGAEAQGSAGAQAAAPPPAAAQPAPQPAAQPQTQAQLAPATQPATQAGGSAAAVKDAAEPSSATQAAGGSAGTVAREGWQDRLAEVAPLAMATLLAAAFLGMSVRAYARRREDPVPAPERVSG